MKCSVSPSMENYLESIYEIGKDRDVVRVKDVAERMGVKMASVTGALQSLAKRELVHYAPYQSISLSKQGKELARCIHNRHRVLTSFLTGALGVTPETAAEDACKLEHVLSPETMDGLLRFMLQHAFISPAEKELIDEYEKGRRGIDG
ncbi:metal-dependent transcriptional regulator [Azotosporobacter soli]|uniref:metal-dependent transcriptional regulator n=1 Tax=Azotosporobacter soli TaxID=3055040 RepID=UPI0031FEE399